MKKSILKSGVLTLALAASLAPGAQAVMGEKTSDVAMGTAVIDGQLDEAYKASTKIELGANKFYYADNAGDESKAPTATAYFLYDTDALYFYIDVNDATVSGSNTTSPWECDSVELFLDYDKKATTLEDAYTDNGGQLRFAAYGEKFNHPPMTFGGQAYLVWLDNAGEYKVQQKIVPKTGGYVVEAKIPYNDEIKPMVKKDALVGMNIQINDAQANTAEEDDTNKRTGIVVWSNGEGGDQSWQWAGSLENLKLTDKKAEAPAPEPETTSGVPETTDNPAAPTTAGNNTDNGNANTADPLLWQAALASVAAFGLFSVKRRK